MVRTIPIWVKLPQLPLHLWGAKSLGKIGSALWDPIVIDECTANKYMISYARILVDVDITQEPIKEIIIKNVEGKKMQQRVEYEWRPNYCDKCQRLGHRCGEKAVKKWIPKQMERKEPEQVHKPYNMKILVSTTSNDLSTVTIGTEPDISSHPAEKEKEEWTVVTKKGRDRGKSHAQPEQTKHGIDWRTLGEDETILKNHDDIEEEVLTFYRKLMGTADEVRNGIDVSAMKEGPQLNNDQRVNLIVPVTEQEVVNALNSIDDMKAP
ncbi:hypothetical protein KIW84_024156 [Lathyrus oleraceus]|uniref:DUF4283 domain-containing protein n=1 Tax=Pisum sativum TaxID=3888 RepID=A0A9D4YIN7_PEA|nr:hypothetical protein KIW84_024156 [Pisum sativum]